MEKSDGKTFEYSQQSNGKASESGLTEREQCELLAMSKENVIEKYARLLTDCQEVKFQLRYYRERLIEVLEKYELLQSKYPEINNAEYNPAWSWVNKIVFVLRKINRPLRSPEIIDLITPHEPALEYSYHKAQSFSANLCKAVKCSRVIAYKLGGTRGYYYVLPEWFDSQGKLIKEYEEKIYLN